MITYSPSSCVSCTWCSLWISLGPTICEVSVLFDFEMTVNLLGNLPQVILRELPQIVSQFKVLSQLGKAWAKEGYVLQPL